MATVSGKAWDRATGATQEGVTVNVGELLSASAAQLVFAGADGDAVTGGKNVVLHLSGGYTGWFELSDATDAKPPVTGQDPAAPSTQPAAPPDPPVPVEEPHHWWDK